jgi:adenine C2-methylase RlmN of 23S rRNA A2503 and tRNA A37
MATTDATSTASSSSTAPQPKGLTADLTIGGAHPSERATSFAASLATTLPSMLTLSSLSTCAEIKEQILEINKSVTSKEPRHSSRALRKFFTKTRRHINRNVLTSAIDDVLANENELRNNLHSFISKVRRHPSWHKKKKISASLRLSIF